MYRSNSRGQLEFPNCYLPFSGHLDPEYRWIVLVRRPQNISAAEKKQTAADEDICNTVEGKFGQGKRRFGLGRIMAKLAGTSAAQISLSFLVMNLELALLRFVLSWRAT